MAIQHPATGFDDVIHRRSRGQKMHAGVLDAPGDREGPEPFAPVFLDAAQNLTAFAQDAGDPIERFDIVHQGWPVEDTDLSHEGRAVARQTALAFD